MKIYTRSGDTGQTSLFGGGRVAKDHLRLEAYGTLDELNSHLGLFRARTRHADLDVLTREIQSRLLDLGAHLATPLDAEKAQKALPPLAGVLIPAMETAIDRLETELPPLTTFILPGGSEEAAGLQVARTVCRRAERRLVGIPPEEIHALAVPYLNRLSDLLFVMARVVVHRAGVTEEAWSPGA